MADSEREIVHTFYEPYKRRMFEITHEKGVICEDCPSPDALAQPPTTASTADPSTNSASVEDGLKQSG